MPERKSNTKILRMMQENFGWADDDSTLAWCGIFVKEALENTGFPWVERFAAARRWLDYEKKCK